MGMWEFLEGGSLSGPYSPLAPGLIGKPRAAKGRAGTWFRLYGISISFNRKISEALGMRAASALF